jgi:hypothetical protein
MGNEYASRVSHNAIAGGVDDPPTVTTDQRQDRALTDLEILHGGGLVFVRDRL